MKGFGKLAFFSVVSFGLGFAAHWYGVDNLLRTGEKGLDTAVETVSQERYDGCRAAFLEETSCYQKEPAPTCEKKIFNQCGADPSTKGKK